MQAERKEQQELRKFMAAHGWRTDKTHGNTFQVGWPDLLCQHPAYGTKWIEVKVKNRPLRKSQIAIFSKWSKFGAKIYVLQGAEEYDLLFRDPNWTTYALYPAIHKPAAGFGQRKSHLDRNY